MTNIFHAFITEQTDASQVLKTLFWAGTYLPILSTKGILYTYESKCFQGSLLLFGHEFRHSNREFASCNLRAQLVKIIECVGGK